ncbi:Outer membrane receptor proteins, mostly Fe transport [Robiginitalea myxolifaciens]|uniref:Outer membrane receptor proteins, mostly Fe transport n=2 Tax=Robiginitalea myxolifaciens TaxID=400055 RepID=A0A1I6FXY9_9FLAO|nr:Outer membrane receptor proteins, mostly Fe transport [Robiginitalea myxolifaciens]
MITNCYDLLAMKSLFGFFLPTLLIILCSHTVNAQVNTEIFGVVTDPSGEPIIGASVYLEGTDKGSQTDFDGKYTITGISPGSYNLIASYLGYETQTKYNILVRSVGTPDFNFVLVESAQQLDEVVVSNANVISRPKETPLSTQSLSAVEIATYPGSNNDVVQVAQTLPGVSPSIGGFRNDLIIRGGAPNETVYYLDGMEIPNINHFATQGSAGGPVGLINVSFIDNVTLSTSAFGAQYDNPLSGVLQFSQRTGNSRDFTGNFRVSASEAALTLEGPLLRKGKEESATTYLVSVRRSYLQFLFEVIGLPFRPNYWDYQYKVNHTLDAYNDISLIGVGSIDDFSVEAPEEFDPEQQAALEQAPFIAQRTNAIGITWKNRFKNGNGFMETTLSNNTLINDFTRYEDPENEVGIVFRNDARESETKLRYAMTNFFDGWKLSSGFNFQYSDYENTTIDQNRQLAFDTQIDFFKYGLFSNITKSFIDNKLDLSFGFRLDDDTFTTEDNLLSTFSPRFSLSYEFQKDWRINASVGRYFKLPPYTILGFRDNAGGLLNENSQYTRSDHFVLGLQHYFGPSSTISLEGFYKRYADYPVSVADQVSLANKGADFEILGSEEIETVGRGRSYGAELQFQQKLTNNFYGILAYTWFFSEFTGFDTEEFLPSVWDSRHLISFTGGYKFNRNWEFSARYRFAGPTPFVPTDLEATLDSYPEVILDYTRLGEENLDIFSQLDIRIDKKWNFEKLALNIFFEAQNILAQNIPQPTEYGLNRDTNGNIVNPRSLVPITAENNQVIPSIGIVLDF